MATSDNVSATSKDVAEISDIQKLAEAIQLQTLSAVNIQPVSFKSPPFWSSNAAAWFTRLEASFATHHPPITNDLTKFQHVIQLLDSDTSRRVHAILSNPPAQRKYEAIKTALLSAFEPTQFQKDSSLLQLNGLGDRRPSELLQYMRSMNTDPSTLFRCLFLHQLPPHVRRILAQTPQATLDQLAATADAIMDADLTSSVFSASVDTHTDNSAPASESEINVLRSSSKFTKNDSSASGTYILCKYHAKFGPKSRRCQNTVNGRECAMSKSVDHTMIAAAGSLSSRSTTISVLDVNTGRSFLVDSGAEESVFPATRYDKQRKHGAHLMAANGSRINTYGKKTFHLQLDKGRIFTHDFWIANVTQPILGADFFVKHNMAIDLANQRLVSIKQKFVLPARATRSTCPGLHRIHSQYEAVLEDFPELLVPSFGSNKHGVEHHISTKGSPVHARPRRLDQEKLAAAKAEFEEMERLGIIRRSSSPWSSPLHMVRKQNGIFLQRTIINSL